MCLLAHKRLDDDSTEIAQRLDDDDRAVLTFKSVDETLVCDHSK